MKDKIPNSFITGSRAYGEPREDSDLDLVVLCDKPTRDKLIEMFGRGRSNKGTEILREVAPVASDAARRVLNKLRAGLDY